MTNGNEPINAVLDTNYREGIPTLENRFEGLSKRELFAYGAMKALISNPNIRRPETQFGEMPKQYSDFTRIAIEYADALISELNRR